MNPVCSSSIQNTRPHFVNEQFAWIGGFNTDFQKAITTHWTYNYPDNAVKDMLCPEIYLQQHTFISPMFLSISTHVSLLLFFFYWDYSLAALTLCNSLNFTVFFILCLLFHDPAANNTCNIPPLLSFQCIFISIAISLSTSTILHSSLHGTVEKR